jgi:hypothetical protein
MPRRRGNANNDSHETIRQNIESKTKLSASTRRPANVESILTQEPQTATAMVQRGRRSDERMNEWVDGAYKRSTRSALADPAQRAPGDVPAVCLKLFAEVNSRGFYLLIAVILYFTLVGFSWLF